MFHQSSLIVCVCSAILLLQEANANVAHRHNLVRAVDGSVFTTDATTFAPVNSTTTAPNTTEAPTTDVPTPSSSENIEDPSPEATTEAPTDAPVSTNSTDAPTTDVPTPSSSENIEDPSPEATTEAPTDAPVSTNSTDAPTTDVPTPSSSENIEDPSPEATTEAPTDAPVSTNSTDAPTTDVPTPSSSENIEDPSPEATTEAPTDAPVSTNSTDAPTTDVPTSSSSDAIQEEIPVTTAARYEVSVVGDATYFVDDIPCGGDGDSCPLAGNTTWKHCHDALPSYQSPDLCVAPFDAVCQVIGTSDDGKVVRGCVWNKIAVEEQSVRTSEAAAPAETTTISQADIASYSLSGLGLVVAIAAIVIATKKAPAPESKNDRVVSETKADIDDDEKVVDVHSHSEVVMEV
ncbi:unnamed protein product [Aphanomyces euteiches]